MCRKWTLLVCAEKANSCLFSQQTHFQVKEENQH